jgi:hypothetical protein
MEENLDMKADQSVACDAAMIIAEINTLPILQGLKQALLQMVRQDRKYFSHDRPWLRVISDLQPAFVGNLEAVTFFEAAWRVMYAAICRLDTIQDHDPTDDIAFKSLPPALQYNQTLAYYIFATHLLGKLADSQIPAERLRRLQQTWSEAMLRMASGQQNDIACSEHELIVGNIEQYQAIAQHKTGATFALAFRGVAILNSDDPALAAKMAIIGQVYGTLLQYSDDLVDRATQTNKTLTLSDILLAHVNQEVQANADMTNAFYHHVLRTHLTQLRPLIESLPPALHVAVGSLFRETFHLQTF